MNNVSLLGRLTRDPELRYTPNGAAVVRFTLAVDRRLSKERRAQAEANNQPTADFISCTAWNKTAELIANYMRKGSQLAVEGRIQTGSYEKDGRTIYTTDVIVNNMDFVGSASDNRGSGQGYQGGYQPGPSGYTNQVQDAPPVNSAYQQNSSQNESFGGASDDDNDGFFPIDNDDIPF